MDGLGPPYPSHAPLLKMWYLTNAFGEGMKKKETDNTSPYCTKDRMCHRGSHNQRTKQNPKTGDKQVLLESVKTCNYEPIVREDIQEVRVSPSPPPHPRFPQQLSLLQRSSGILLTLDTGREVLGTVKVEHHGN